MSVVIDVLGSKVTFNNGKASADHEPLLDLVKMALLGYHSTSQAAFDPDLDAAEHVADWLGGKIITHTIPERGDLVQSGETTKAKLVVAEALSRALAAVELSGEPSLLLPKPDLNTFDSKTASSVILQAMKGGKGSGYFGHAGRPGRVGGSAGGGAARAGLSDIFNFKADPEGAKKFREKYDPLIAKIENEKLRTAMQLISKCVNEVALNGSKANSHQVIADLNTVRGMMDDLVSQDLSKNDQDIIDGFSDDRLFSYISPESSFYHSIDATIQSIAGRNIRGKSMIDYAMSNVMQGVDQVDDESILTAVGYQEKKIETLPNNFGRIVVERDKTVLECNAADSDFHTTISASYIISHKDQFEDYEIENARRVLINNTNEDTGVEDVALEKMQGLKLTRETEHVLEVVPEGSKSPDGSPTDALNRAVKLTQRWLKSGFIPDIFKAFNFAGVFRFTDSKLMTVDHFVGEYPDLSIEFKEKTEKGGAGSGDFGHAGRPGKVGGSSGGGVARAGSQYEIGDRFNFITKISAKNKATALAAFDLISKVHTDGGLNLINIKENSTKNAAQMVHRISDGMPFEMDMSKVTPPVPVDVCHEVGHAIEATLKAGKIIQDGPAEVAKIEKLIQDNPGTKRMADTIKNFKTEKIEYTFDSGKKITYPVRLDYTYYLYLQKPHELFARAYAQYIATRSKDLAALADIKKYGKDTIVTVPIKTKTGVIFSTSYPIQWHEDEFEPIAQAFDGLLEKMGWKK